MKYICKNGKIYGIASNNWDDLSNHPSINSTLLDQAKDYTTDELNIIKGPMSLEEYNAIDPKNPNTIYVVSTDTSTPLEQVNYLDLQNKPLINGVVLTGDKSLASLSIYSISQIDNLMASLRAIKVVATKPSSSEIIPNTQYYVGTTTPYHVYLYDSNKNEIDLGTSEVQQIQAGSGLTLSNGVMDHSNNISPKTNTKIAGVSYDGQGHITGKSSEYDVSTTLSLSSTDLQIPTSKTIFDKTPQASLTHLQAGDLTTMDDFFSLLLEAEDTTHVTSTKVRTGFGYVTLPQFIINDLTAIGLTNTGYGNAFFKAQKVKSSTDALHGYIELQYLYGFSSAINIKNSTGWSGWKLKQCDSFAPISTSKYVSTFKSPNDCIVPFGFNRILNMSNERATIEGLFVSQMTDPINSSINLFGALKVMQQCYGGSSGGTATNIVIEQTFETFLRGTPTQRKVFFRRGYVANSATDININDTTAIANAITWLNWYPLEYPRTGLSKPESATNITNLEATFTVTGGIMIIQVRHLKSSVDIGRTSSYIAINYPPVPKKDSLMFGMLYPFDTTETAPCGIQPSNGGQVEIFGVKANIRYIGSITMPLGY